MSMLTKRSPSPAFAPFEGDDGINSLFRRMFNESASNGFLWAPSVEVNESNDRLELTAELPGMSEDDLTITVENNVLTIAGEKKAEREERSEDARCLVSERYFGAFTRAFTLPRSVDADAVDAGFENGVLTVTLPKTPQAKGRVIAVTAGKKK